MKKLKTKIGIILSDNEPAKARMVQRQLLKRKYLVELREKRAHLSTLALASDQGKPKSIKAMNEEELTRMTNKEVEKAILRCRIRNLGELPGSIWFAVERSYRDELKRRKKETKV